MKKIKYTRTSSSAQMGQRFLVDTQKYDEVYFDQGISGTKPFRERTNGMKIISLVEQGLVKEICFPELRDLGRSLYDSISVLEFFDNHNVIVTIQSLGNLQSIVDGKKNPIWTMISSIMSSLYEIELDNLRLRTHMGRQSYIMRGGKLIRKICTKENVTTFMNKPKIQKMISLLKRVMSATEIVVRHSVSAILVNNVRRILRTCDEKHAQGDYVMAG